MSQSNTPLQVEYQIKYTPRLVFSILGPYYFEKLKEQVKAILPISLFLLVFQFLVFRLLNIENPIGIAAGMCCVVIGLMFLMDGPGEPTGPGSGD